MRCSHWRWNRAKSHWSRNGLDARQEKRIEVLRRRGVRAIPLLVRRGGCGTKKISAKPTLAPRTGWSLTPKLTRERPPLPYLVATRSHNAHVRRTAQRLRLSSQPLNCTQHVDWLSRVSDAQPHHPVGIRRQSLEQFRVCSEVFHTRIPTLVITARRKTSRGVPRLVHPLVRLSNFKRT